MSLDEALAGRHRATHQHVEGLVGPDSVVDGHLEQCALVGVHRRVPKLLGVHLAQALVALDLESLALQFGSHPLQLLVAVDPLDIVSLPDRIEWRLGNVEITINDETF